MIFLLILTLIIGAQSLFSYHLFQLNNPVTLVFGILQLVVLLTSIVVMMSNYRRKQTTNYRRAFYAFGLVVATGIPTVAYLPFGLSFSVIGLPLIQWIGWAVAGMLFLAIVAGIIWGRWNWKTHEIDLDFQHLPADLNGLRIIHISDIHIGSFFNQYHKVQKAIDLINSLKADYVLFTGDLVNNIASEMHGWEPLFLQIQAKMGKYSILGNHDYGDYVPWDAKEDKKSNLAALIEMHRAIGFTPLLNEHVQLSSMDEGAFLIGIENWGKKPFRQSGDLEKASGAISTDAFSILMSHDPSHFDEQVIGSGIDLTLSGHTHGMQFGIERFGIKFSPVQFYYKKWAGLYQTGKQFLYVNRGFGYLGFPGRVGIYPEITLIRLNKTL